MVETMASVGRGEWWREKCSSLLLQIDEVVGREEEMLSVALNSFGLVMNRRGPFRHCRN